MDTWTLLVKELNYYGIKLINNKKCHLSDDNGDVKVQGVIKTVRLLNGHCKKQKKLLLSLWNEITEILQDQSLSLEIIDENMINLFVFSLKDLTKYLLCFDEAEKSEYYMTISKALSKDIK